VNIAYWPSDTTVDTQLKAATVPFLPGEFGQCLTGVMSTGYKRPPHPMRETFQSDRSPPEDPSLSYPLVLKLRISDFREAGGPAF
jgi:hypothetical protein